MRRGEWLVTHQGIAFDVNGVLVDGQHRLAAIIEAERPVELTVFSEVAEGTFDVLDIGKRRTAADVLAIEGEKNSTMLAAMVRTVWLYHNRPDLTWTGGAASYLVERANRRADLAPWYEGIIDGAGLRKGDPRLQFRRVMFNMARRQTGQPLRRRDTREHLALYLKAFNAWQTDEPLPQLRFTSREAMPRLTTTR